MKKKLVFITLLITLIFLSGCDAIGSFVSKYQLEVFINNYQKENVSYEIRTSYDISFLGEYSTVALVDGNIIYDGFAYIEVLEEGYYRYSITITEGWKVTYHEEQYDYEDIPINLKIFNVQDFEYFGGKLHLKKERCEEYRVDSMEIEVLNKGLEANITVNRIDGGSVVSENILISKYNYVNLTLPIQR